MDNTKCSMDADRMSTCITKVLIPGQDTRDVQRQLEDLGGGQVPTDLVSTSAPWYLDLGVLSVFEDTPRVSVVLRKNSDLHTRVGLLGIQLGLLTAFEYMIEFLNCAGHTSILFSIERDLIEWFIRGFTFPLCLASDNLIAARSTLPLVVSHTMDVDYVCIEICRGSGKGTCH